MNFFVALISLFFLYIGLFLLSLEILLVLLISKRGYEKSVSLFKRMLDKRRKHHSFIAQEVTRMTHKGRKILSSILKSLGLGVKDFTINTCSLILRFCIPISISIVIFLCAEHRKDSGLYPSGESFMNINLRQESSAKVDSLVRELELVKGELDSLKMNFANDTI